MLSCGLKNCKIFLILSCNHRVLRVVGLGGGEESLDAEEDGAEGHGRSPLVLQDVQADGPRHARDVGVPDLGDEAHFGRVEGVCVWYFDF